MEAFTTRRRKIATIVALSAVALPAALVVRSTEGYSTDPSNVHCDDERTRIDLKGNGIATFVVHGKQEGDVAMVRVRRTDEGASVGVSGDVTGPPQQLEADGFTAPAPMSEGVELSTFGAGGAWMIDVRKNDVTIQGTCEGM